MNQSLVAAVSSIKQGTITGEATSDVAMAGRFLADLGAIDGEIVSTRGSLYRYSHDTGTWDELRREHAVGLIQCYDGVPLIVRTSSGEQTKTFSLSSGRCKAIYEAALNHVACVELDFFDTAPSGVAFANGFVRVGADGVDFSPCSPAHRALSCLPFNYDPDADFPAWRGVLGKVLEGDDANDCRLALQEFAGACLTGIAANYTRCVVLSGDGENGKSVVGETLAEMLPSDAVSYVTPQSWVREYYLAQIRSSRLNLASELPDADIQASDVFKQVIDGAVVVAREPHGKPFSFRPRAGHLFLANTLPSSSDNSHGFWRRFLVIDFRHDFSRDTDRQTKPAIKRALAAEWAGIALWALHGAVRLLRNGRYTEPDRHRAALKEWRLDVDPIAAFVDACCARSVDFTALRIIYPEYVAWCERSGRKAASDRTLGRRLKALKIEQRRTNLGAVYGINVLDRSNWASGKSEVQTAIN